MVDVKEPTKVSSIELSETEATMEVGEDLTLTASILPDNANNKSVNWTSDNADVATVVDGVITAVSPGECNITCASTDESNVSAVCHIVVKVLAKIQESAHVKKGLIASGDMFVDNADELARIKGLYHDVLAVDMESAAIAQVCHIKRVPFISIRVVSDTPGETDNTAQYEHFWDDAPLQTFHVLTQIVDTL